MPIRISKMNNRIIISIPCTRLVFGLMLLFASLCCGCHKSLDRSANSGESHFLMHCDKECKGELQCISNLCTTKCTANGNECEKLSKASSCVSANSGGVSTLICDLSCKANADCHSVNEALSCKNGSCRGPVVDADASSSDDNTSPPIDAGGELSDVLDASNDSTDANRTCTEGDCLVVGSVIPCPADGNIITDSLSVVRAVIVGDTLTLDVTHPGGCAQHHYTLCYVEFDTDVEMYTEGIEPAPELTTHLIHDANGDTCETLLTQTLQFDLTPIANMTIAHFSEEGGLIHTEYGYYSFGLLTCEERQTHMGLLRSDAVEAFDSCSNNDDCSNTWFVGSCYAGCQKSINKAYQQEFDKIIEELEDRVCADYETDGCPPVSAPPCIDLRPTCVEGECTEL